MENGIGVPPAHANGHVEQPRTITYRVLGEGARVRYSPFSRTRRCPCRTTYTYPNDLVLSVDGERSQLLNTNRALEDERRQLTASNRALTEEVEGLDLIVSVQETRITDLEQQLATEIAGAAAAREELRRAQARLARVNERVRDRTAGLRADMAMLATEVSVMIESSSEDSDPEEESD